MNISAAVLAATNDRYGSMALFFVIAMVITGPLAIRTLRRSFAQRASAIAALRGYTADESDPLATPDAANAEGRDGDLTAVIASIDAAAAMLGGSSDPHAEIVVVMPVEATLRGRCVPDDVARALIDDALRRGGINVVHEERDGAERHLSCRALVHRDDATDPARRSNPLPKPASSDTI